MRKNFIERGRSQVTIWRMRIACWMTEATRPHSQYVILIAYPRQQCLQERALMLRLYLHCMSCYTFLTL